MLGDNKTKGVYVELLPEIKKMFDFLVHRYYYDEPDMDDFEKDTACLSFLIEQEYNLIQEAEYKREGTD